MRSLTLARTQADPVRWRSRDPAFHPEPPRRFRQLLPSIPDHLAVGRSERCVSHIASSIEPELAVHKPDLHRDRVSGNVKWRGFFDAVLFSSKWFSLRRGVR